MASPGERETPADLATFAPLPRSYGALGTGELIMVASYLGVLRRWAWLLVLGALLAGAASTVVSRSLPAVYQASAKLKVSGSSSSGDQDTLNAILSAERLTRTYSELIKT